MASMWPACGGPEPVAAGRAQSVRAPAATVALAHFAFVTNDHHRAPVLDEVVGALLAKPFVKVQF